MKALRTHRQPARLLIAAVVLTTALAGCGSAEEATALPPGRQPPPTLAAPPYTASAGPVTAETLDQVTLLGRLDQPETSSTLFAHTVSPDGTRLIGLNNDEILGWDLLSGALTFRTARLDAIAAYSSPDKTEVYTIGPAGRVVIYDAETGAERGALQAHDAFNSVIAYDPLTGRAALGGSDGRVRVWDLPGRTALAEIQAHPNEVTALALSNDGETLATASIDSQARLWRWRDRSLLGELPLENVLVYRMAFAPDDNQLALGSASDVRLWSTADAADVRRLPSVSGGAAQVLAYSPDGQFLAGGNASGGLAVWNPVLTTLVGVLPVSGAQLSVDYAPEGDLLLTSSLGEGASVFNLAAASGQTVPRGDLPLPGSAIYAVEWTDDGRLLLMFDASGPVYVWGLATA